MCLKKANQVQFILTFGSGVPKAVSVMILLPWFGRHSLVFDERIVRLVLQFAVQI